MHPRTFATALRQIGLASMLVCTLASAVAQEALIRKNLGNRLSALSKIDEISKTPMKGLYEVRVNGTDIFYTDAKGNFLIQGALLDTQAKRNLTEERIEKLSAIDFSALPIKDAITQVRGNGKRQLAVFEDPNCGYCKTFERDLQQITDVTVYTFLIAILSPDSGEKSKNIWCAEDKNKAWLDWMVRDQPAAKVSCDISALQRNFNFSRKYKISATPTMFFVDGARVAGAVGVQEIEKRLLTAKAP